MVKSIKHILAVQAKVEKRKGFSVVLPKYAIILVTKSNSKTILQKHSALSSVFTEFYKQINLAKNSI